MRDHSPGAEGPRVLAAGRASWEREPEAEPELEVVGLCTVGRGSLNMEPAVEPAGDGGWDADVVPLPRLREEWDCEPSPLWRALWGVLWGAL